MDGKLLQGREMEAEVARDRHAVPAKGQQGVEVVIERDRWAVAVIRAQRPGGHSLGPEQDMLSYWIGWVALAPQWVDPDPEHFRPPPRPSPTP